MVQKNERGGVFPDRRRGNGPSHDLAKEAGTHILHPEDNKGESAMNNTRRQFFQAAGALGMASQLAAQDAKVPANDRIRIATIGFGGMGSGDTAYALSVPGVGLAAVCDVYDGRLTRAREIYGSQIFTTRDYREILARKDVDAVIIGTPDHWPSRISINAL